MICAHVGQFSLINATQVVFNSILNMKNKSYTSTHLMKRSTMQLTQLNAYRTSHAKYAIQPDSPSSMQPRQPVEAYPHPQTSLFSSEKLVKGEKIKTILVLRKKKYKPMECGICKSLHASFPPVVQNHPFPPSFEREEMRVGTLNSGGMCHLQKLACSPTRIWNFEESKKQKRCSPTRIWRF